MLAAVVVIIAVGAFGERVKHFYCEIVLAIAPDVDAPACDGVFVNCNILSASPFILEASVTDNKGADDITRVEFSVDGTPYRTEKIYRYCMDGGDARCEDGYPGASGRHTFTAVAYDAEGNTGTCSVTAIVP